MDSHCEVLKTPVKDIRLKAYMDLFLGYYNSYGMNGLTEYIKNSSFQQQQYTEQQTFAQDQIRDPDQYDYPPDSVEIMPIRQFESVYCQVPNLSRRISDVLVYHVGMNNIRSDPYTGMAALYHFLYGRDNLIQVLHFPNIYYCEWCNLRQTTKTYRMYKEFCHAILFSDGLILQNDL